MRGGWGAASASARGPPPLSPAASWPLARLVCPLPPPSPPGNYACATSAASSVLVPVGDGYISGLKIAVAKTGPPYVGQLVFSVTPRGGGAVATYACGSAGGLAVPLFKPVEALAAFNLETGCVAAGAGRRRLAQTTKTLNLDALRVQVVPAPAGADAPALTAELNGVPLAGTLSAAQLAAVAVANGDAAPEPTVTPTPTPTPGPPTVTQSTTNLASSATTLVITGTGFDATPSGNTVVLSSGAFTISSATSTQLTLTLTTPPTAGTLTAVVTAFGGSSGAAVQVATVVDVTVAQNSANLASNATTLIITGTGFDSTPSGNSVQLSSGAATVTSATSTQLTILLTTAPSPGTLTAVVTSFGGSSGAAVQVANIYYVGQYAYIINLTTITACMASGTTLTGCIDTGATPVGLPYGISVVGGTAFVTDRSGNNAVTACLVSGSSVSGCTSAASGFNNPRGIAIDAGIAYVTNNDGNTVTACTVSGSTLTGCTTAASGFIRPEGIAVAGGIVYVTNYDSNTVTACTASGLSLTGCTTAASGISTPIAIAVAGGVAYVSSNFNNAVTTCTISGSSLTGCTTAASAFPYGSSFGIAIV